MTLKAIDLSSSDINNIHIVGIGGAGMSAIAHVLICKGKNITGSDLKDSKVTQRLISQGIEVAIPHNGDVVDDNIDIVVISSAIDEENVEVIKAKSLNIPIYSRAAMLSAICASEKSIGVAGSHGKTTTTSMLTTIARFAGLAPSFMIGGDLNEIGTNAKYNKGSYLIVEADESDKTFLDLSLVASIVTNIESDHLENYDNSFENLKNSFIKFVEQTNGPIVICVDEENARAISEHCKETKNIITIGKNDALFTYNIISRDSKGIDAEIYFGGELKGTLKLAVPGEHNVRNALCALALMLEFDVDFDVAISALASYGGVARRFQPRGTVNGITLIDDYAHLPTEIEVTLSAAHDGQFNNVIAVFQPHRYSRTQELYKEFAKALTKADIVCVTEVYSAGEEVRVGVSGQNIVDEMKKNGFEKVVFAPHKEDVINFVIENASAKDIVLTLGAGDVTTYPDAILEASKNGA